MRRRVLAVVGEEESWRNWPWYLWAYVLLIMGGGIVAGVIGLWMIATGRTPY